MRIVCTCIKTHGSVSCGPRKQDIHKRSKYIDRKNKVAIFMHLYVYSSMMSDQNSTKFTMEVPSTLGGHIPNLKISSAISEIQTIKLSKKLAFFLVFACCRNRCNLHMRASIWLKFVTHIGGLKANISKSNFFHAYRINCF